MKKLLLPLLTFVLFSACQKRINTDKVQEEFAGSASIRAERIIVCHYDMLTQTSSSIEIPQSALTGHLNHGDVVGNCSDVVKTICNQDWMVRNLDVTTYRNGDPIPQVSNLDPAEWNTLTTGAWCYFNNDPANGATYGKLYNWFAVNDVRGLAPAGWHIASATDWTTMINCLGGFADAGGRLKETGTTHWLSPNEGANESNTSGFKGLPGGLRYSLYSEYFQGLNMQGYWWTSTVVDPVLDPGHAISYGLNYNNGSVGTTNGNLAMGMSVRCARN